MVRFASFWRLLVLVWLTTQLFWMPRAMHCCLSYETIKCMLVEEPDGLNTEMWFVESSICSYKLSMPIDLFNFLPCMPCAPWSIHFLGCYIRHSIFALANAGLITHGGIYMCLGVILIRYAQYILALRVRYVCYTLVCNARSFSWFEFACHFESHLARHPPFICACKHDDFRWTFHCYYVTQYTYYIFNLFV